MFKRTAAVLVMASVMAIFFSTTAMAQVCVVDVAKVFESHPQFKAQLENLKQQAEEYKFLLQQQGEKLRSESEQLKNYEVGSPEYKQLETRLAQASANLEVDRRNKTREFVQAEARLHFDTYVSVTRLISNYCEQNNFRAALRYSQTQMNPADPNTIMQRVNEYVVFHRPQIDITPAIIQALEANATQVGERALQSQNR